MYVLGESGALAQHLARVLGYAADLFRVLFAASDVSDANGIDTVMAILTRHHQETPQPLSSFLAPKRRRGG